ncbi:MAG: hypothetical protein VSS75_015220 [Candidatus Parabeggiatoa sp.]|nr:hypothetical protein [Candidatus Parabeggiatoa sp.]
MVNAIEEEWVKAWIEVELGDDYAKLKGNVRKNDTDIYSFKCSYDIYYAFKKYATYFLHN